MFKKFDNYQEWPYKYVPGKEWQPAEVIGPAYIPSVQPYRPIEVKTVKNVNDIQHGGNHYKVVKYQPWDVVEDWDLGYLDGTALKYISRWKKKNGLEDIKKAIHFLQKLVETEEAKEKKVGNDKAGVT